MALTTKQSIFIDEYLKDYNATKAAIRAGYSPKTAHNIGWENLRKREIAETIDRYVESFAVGRNERLAILAEIARTGTESNRLAAVKQLGELSGDFVKKVEHSGTVTAPTYDLTNKSGKEIDAILSSLADAAKTIGSENDTSDKK